MVLTWLAGLLVLTIWASPVAAQHDGNRRTLPAGQIELARLVDLAADQLDLNITYDAGTLRGSVTLRLGEGVSDDELWQFVNHVLAARGFTTVRMPGDEMLSVVKLSEAAGLSRVDADTAGDFPGEMDAPQAGYRTVVVRTEHRPVDALMRAARLVLSKSGGAITVVGDTKLLMISDLAPRIEQAVSLIEQLDQPDEQAIVETVSATARDAEDLVALVRDVAEKRKAVSGIDVPGDLLASTDGCSVIIVAPRSELSYWKELVERLDQQEATRNVVYAPRHFGVSEVARLVQDLLGSGGGGGSDERFHIIVDDLTGSMIVSATASQHEQIRDLMQRLDATTPESRRGMRSFAIRNRSVNEIVVILENLLDAGVISTGGFEPMLERRSSRTQPGDGARSTDSTVSRPHSPDVMARADNIDMESAVARPSTARDELVLLADEGTNKLIAVGEPRLLEQLAPLIAELDVQQPQVMLEVMLVGLTEGQSRDLGIELEKIVISGDTTVRLASLFGLSSAGGTAARVVGDGLGFTGTVVDPGDFSIIVRALETVSQGRTLSRPRLLVRNAQTATFDAVLQEPFASVNASDTVATTTLGGFENAGTSVTIRPQIAEGDHVVLEYSVRLSSFVGESANPNLPPPRQENSVQSVVTIPDGHTVVVGGLESLTEGDSESRVPLLGSLPLIGEAFKNRSRSNSRSRFYVFIRAEVMRDRGFESLKYISEYDRGDAGLDDGWPVVEPRVIR